MSHIPGLDYFLLRHFPEVFAELNGADFETANAILLHRFGVLLPGQLKSADECAQAAACFRVMERVATAEGRR